VFCEKSVFSPPDPITLSQTENRKDFSIMATDDKRIIIFDTTLRDGEQALPQSLSMRQKLQIALSLEQLGVDVIEAGFPVSSEGDFESVRTIAQTLKTSIPCGH